MRKILHVSASASGYGAENSLFMLVTNLPAGFEPFVAVPEEGPLTAKLRRAGVPVIVFPYAVLHRKHYMFSGFARYMLSLAASTVKFVLLLRQIEPDAVHSNTSTVMPAALAARLTGIPHFWHVREIPRVPRFLWNTWSRCILLLSFRVICISRAVCRQFPPTGKTVVVHNGIDTAMFDACAGRGRNGENRRVGMAGRINYWKGHGLFLDVAAAVSRQRPDTRFFIMGDARDEYGKLAGELHKKARDYGMAERVVFTGFLPREKMAEVMGTLNVFVLPSLQPEPFGLVVIEAMACGNTVVAPAEGGPVDIIEDGVSGMLVKPGSCSAYARAVAFLLDNPQAAREMGERARARVKERFGIQRTAEKIAELYMQAGKNRSQ